MNANNNPINANKTTEFINKLYDNLSFLDMNTTSVLLFIFITFFVVVISTYFNIMKNSQKVKQNWESERCKPNIMPIAGLINKPDDEGILEYTRKNFYSCVTKILSNNLQDSMKPFNINEMLDSAKDSYNNIDLSMNFINDQFEKMQLFMCEQKKELTNKFINLMIPMQKMMFTVNDTFARTQSVLVAGLYTSLGNSYLIKSMISESIKFITEIFVLLIVTISVMFVIPGLQGFAATTAAVAIPLSAVFITTNNSLAKIFHVTPGKMPKIPKCFDKNTLLIMNDGTNKTIEDICVGDILEGDNIVTATFKLGSNGVTMYDYNGTIVSDCHNVFHEGIFKQVKDCPQSIKINSYSSPYIYCLNTSKKIIKIGNNIYLDWDELYDDCLAKILNYNVPCCNIGVGHKSSIHKFLDGGFAENTKLMMHDFSIKLIKDIKIGDVLLNGEKVYGLVHIKGDDLFDVNKFSLGRNNYINGGSNLNMVIDNTIISTLQTDKILSNYMNSISYIEKPPKLYHLLTDKKSFYVGTIKFLDYNSLIDTILSQ